MKRTVIVSKINDDHTAFVMNMGIEELSLFKKLKNTGIELKEEDKLSDEEILMLLRHCCEDGFIEAVFSIENNNKEDQKEINIIKQNFENKLKAKGLTIITHTEWTPNFNIGPDVKQIINKRNYLTLIMENIYKNENKLNELEEDYKQRRIQLEQQFEQKEKNLEREFEIKNNDIINRRNELEEEIKINREKIKKQNWYIEQTKTVEDEYNKAKELLNKEIERYKKGKEYNDNLIHNLPQEVQTLLNEKNKLQNEQNNIKKNILSLQNELKQLQDAQNNEKIRYNKLKETEYNNLINDIVNNINALPLSKQEMIEKFKRTCKMYILNDRKIPEYEFEYSGLSKDEIDNIINNIITTTNKIL